MIARIVGTVSAHIAIFLAMMLLSNNMSLEDSILFLLTILFVYYTGYEHGGEEDNEKDE